MPMPLQPTDRHWLPRPSRSAGRLQQLDGGSDEQTRETVRPSYRQMLPVECRDCRGRQTGRHEQPGPACLTIVPRMHHVYSVLMRDAWGRRSGPAACRCLKNAESWFHSMAAVVLASQLILPGRRLALRMLTARESEPLLLWR